MKDDSELAKFESGRQKEVWREDTDDFFSEGRERGLVEGRIKREKMNRTTRVP